MSNTDWIMQKSPSPSGRKKFQVGTLTYTTAGLGALFFWLLWGDFCFFMLGVVWKNILPLQIKALSVPDWVIGLITVSIPSTLNTLLNPVISTTSDRFRSRWGRRRPFMMVATPFIAVFMMLLGLAPEIGRWFYEAGLGQWSGWSAGVITAGVIALLVFLFYTADLFVGTVFWYLFNDVVPHELMARFLALFRLVGSGAGVLFNYFIFPHAMERMSQIFFGAGLLYLVVFTLMCIFVKEGKYPPPEPLASRPHPWAWIKAYVRECTSKKIYILLYVHVVLWTLANICGVFSVFANLSLGLTMQQIGTLAAVTGAIQMFLTYPAGMLADRFHPLRLMLWMELAIVVLTPLGFVFLLTDFKPEVNYWILFVFALLNMPLNLLYAATLMPLYMRLFPREKFGQFCSFNAMSTALAAAIGGVLGGLFIGKMRNFWPESVYGENYYYRLIPAWDFFFSVIALLVLILLYREWRKTNVLETVSSEAPADCSNNKSS
jgi:MFS family permease